MQLGIHAPVNSFCQCQGFQNKDKSKFEKQMLELDKQILEFQKFDKPQANKEVFSNRPPINQSTSQNTSDLATGVENVSDSIAGGANNVNRHSNSSSWLSCFSWC